MDLAKCISDATQEIFQSMLMAEARPSTPLSTRSNVFKDSVSGLVGLAGNYRGMLAIHVPNAVAMSITSKFLFMDVEEINDDVKDAIGELANMLAGSVKSMLTETGTGLKLAIPSAISGTEYEVECLSDSDGAIVPFNIDEGEFLVECYLQNS
ncbi:MAG: chemotaxis protein CheX [Desulfuromonadales bacterium]|nr:chemotaxis protein CheX [Desulfuromonadales bacterium]